jgi:argininosuccinate lyase
MTELADHLVREHRLPFRTAHAIAAGLMQGHRERRDASLADILVEVSSNVLGAPLTYTDAALADVLDPQHFVAVRRTLGGPAPVETARALAEGGAALERDARWLGDTRDGLRGAENRLRERSQRL